MIPLVDLAAQHKKLGSTLIPIIRHVMKESAFIQGRAVTTFERSFARYLGTKYCVGVGSGTDALLAALRALHIGHGDSVIVPAFTFVSTAFAVIASGAQPILIDVDPTTLTLNPSLITAAITPKTKAIIPVHLYGTPAAMDEILRIAKKHKLAVIEDAAQAHGSRYKGKKAGTIGDIGCFSFYPSKNLGAFGDGGAVVTRSAKLAKIMRTYCNIGQTRKYKHTMIGINSRLDTIQAAILNSKLVHLDTWNRERASIASLYQTLLKDLPIILPHVPIDRISNYHLFVLRTPRRQGLKTFLHQKGVDTGIHYPSPLHLEPALSFLGYTKGMFPVSERAAREALSLPMYPELSLQNVRTIASYIHAYFRLRK